MSDDRSVPRVLAPPSAERDTSPRLEEGQLGRRCAWNPAHAIAADARKDAETCSAACRKARHRFLRHIGAVERADSPLSIGVADPPYPERSRLYRGHPDYAGEVDLAELLIRLRGFDGWALATSAKIGLKRAIVLLEAMGMEYDVASWCRGSRPQPRARGLSSWEPVLYHPARALVSRSPVADTLIWSPQARTSDPGWVIGAKPGPWWSWVFDLVAARPGDRFDDLYPGSGGGSKAWAAFEARGVARDGAAVSR